MANVEKPSRADTEAAPTLNDSGRGAAERSLRATVLVVDDEPAVARLLALTLEEEGMLVRIAVDGTSALEAFQEITPDVVLLDLKLPDMNGRDVFRRMRELGGRAPVVIVSANGAREAQRELAADAAIGKPFDPRVVLERVRALLDKR